jgi:hypothetical protein
MSKPWNPNEDLARARRTWPPGAIVGLALVAAACIGVVVTLYRVAGPSDVFEQESPPSVEQ